MTKSILLSLLIWNCLGSLAAQELDRNNLGIDLDHLSTIKRAVQTDPITLKSWSINRLNSWKAPNKSIPWVRSMVGLALAVSEQGSLVPLATRYEQVVLAAEFAKDLNLADEYIILMNTLTFVPDREGNTLSDETLLPQLLDYADRQDLPGPKVRVRMDLAYYLRTIGNVKEALRLLDETNEIAQQAHNLDPMDRILIHNQTAITYLGQDRPEEANKIHREIAQFCQEQGLRYLGAITNFNIAKYAIGKEQFLEARPFLDLALDDAVKLQLPSLEATVRTSLGHYYRKQKEYTKAIHQIAQARELFEKTSDDIGIADASLEMTKLFVAMGKIDLALKEIATAESIYSRNNYQYDVSQVEKTKAEIAESQKNYQQALNFYKRYLFKIQDINFKKSEKNYSELMVSMGLKVEAERNKALEKENRLQQEVIAQGRIAFFALIVVSILFLCTFFLLFLVNKRSREVRESKAKMKQTLDNIEEGILTFDENLVIQSETSRFLNNIFSITVSPAGHNAIDFLFKNSSLNAERIAMIRDVFKMGFGMDILSWQVNMDHLVEEYEILLPEPKSLHLTWTPVFDSKGLLTSCIVTIVDQTETKKLSLKIEEEKRRGQARETKIIELAMVDIHSSAQLLHELIRELDQIPVNQADQVALLRSLHTYKGTARTLGLSNLSLGIHQLEGKILETQQYRSELGPAPLAELKGLSQEYIDILQKILKGDPQASSFLERLSLMTAYLTPMVESMLKEQDIALGGILIDDEILHIPKLAQKDISHILTHAITNSIDHGFIIPKKNGNKVGEVKLSIRAYYRDDAFILQVEDNGAGIDLQRLELLAKQRGISAEVGPELTALLFQDGMSTASEVSTSSGRGVGLAAIKSLCEKWQGDCQLLPNPSGVGSTLIAKLKIAR